MFSNKVKSIVLGVVVVAAFSITAAAVGGNMTAQSNGGTGSMTSSNISAVSDTVEQNVSAPQVDSTVPSSEPSASSQASSSSEASSSKPSINGTINSDGLIVQVSPPHRHIPNGNAYPDTEAGN